MRLLLKPVHEHVDLVSFARQNFSVAASTFWGARQHPQVVVLQRHLSVLVVKFLTV